MRRSLRIMTAMAALGGITAGCSESVAPEVADQLVVADGDDQEAVTPHGGGHLLIGSGWMPDSLRVRLTDPAGEPVAGRTVVWSTTAGSVSPAASTTDAEGMATTRWSFHSPATGWASVGAHQAQAAVAGAAPVTFTGHARAGVTIGSISFTPDTVIVQSGGASGSVAVTLTDDRRDAAVQVISLQLYNPSANSTDFQSTVANLALTAGTAADGEWTGSFDLPADAEHGAWFLGRMTVSWGCGGENRATLLDGALEALGLTHQLHVVPGPGGLLTGAAARDDLIRTQAFPELAASSIDASC